MIRVKVIYRKNLRMSEGKIAAQVAHSIIGLGITDPRCIIVVLGVSNNKFKELTQNRECYIHHDLGLTEVDNGEKTSAAWIEE